MITNPHTAKQKYTPPAIEAGETCSWLDHYSKPETTGMVALVTSVGQESIDIGVLVPGSTVFLPRMGLRHKDDPNKQVMDQVNEGCWVHLPSRRAPASAQALEEVMGIVVKLQEKVASLNGQVMALKRKKFDPATEAPVPTEKPSTE